MKWFFLVSLITTSMGQTSPVVKTSSGPVRGRISNNGKFYEYFGIPYGIVNSTNRFQAPLPAPQWNKVFEAINDLSFCPQKSLSLSPIGEPDCLKLNVYAPVKAKYLPVMVFIHGGCFFSGTGSPLIYGGDFFAEKGVVLVTINYRLNVEGFLCLGIKEAPGNAGLKDQIAALRWVQKNIASFGGNPNRVTLFGESAGGSSTAFMILSPATRGLFHQAILQSGSSLAPWALQHDPIKTASTLVKKFGYDTKDPHEIYKILSNKKVNDLVLALNNEKKYCVADVNIFVPCVEKVIDGIEPAMTEHPAKTILSGDYNKVPMIIGNTDKEGIYFVSRDYGTSLPKGTHIDIMSNLQNDLDFPNYLEKNQTAELLKKYYFSHAGKDLVLNMVELYSDYHFKMPTAFESKMYAMTSFQPIYYYKFQYYGLLNFAKFRSGYAFVNGASHADELFYLFRPGILPIPQKALENTMITRLVKMWTNFAKYGDPVPKRTKLLPFDWNPSHERNPQALVLDTKFSTAPMWNEKSVKLWTDLYQKYKKTHYGFN